MHELSASKSSKKKFMHVYTISFVVNQKFNFKTISLIFYSYGAIFSEFI